MDDMHSDSMSHLRARFIKLRVFAYSRVGTAYGLSKAIVVQDKMTLSLYWNRVECSILKTDQHINLTFSWAVNS